jgi:transposase
MPKPYSLDLRERVVGFVENGHSRRAAAAHFRVSVSFVVNLMKAVRTRGSFEPKPSGGRRHAKLEPHRSFLLAQVVEKADITMPELAVALAATIGERADPASLSRWLIRAGYRFKKKVCEPASKIAPTSSRRARNGPASANRRCGLSRTGWSSSTRPEPPPR